MLRLAVSLQRDRKSTSDGECMGKVRPSNIKILCRILVAQYEDHLSTDFEENKEFLAQVVQIPTKKLRNRVAGYITRLMTILARQAEYA